MVNSASNQFLTPILDGTHRTAASQLGRHGFLTRLMTLSAAECTMRAGYAPGSSRQNWPKARSYRRTRFPFFYFYFVTYLGHNCSVIKSISYTDGFVTRKRLFLNEAQIGFSYTVKKESFRLNFFRLSFLIWRIQSIFFSDWICQSKNSVETFYTCLFNLSHRSSCTDPTQPQP